jgi:hypothetical protein
VVERFGHVGHEGVTLLVLVVERHRPRRAVAPVGGAADAWNVQQARSGLVGQRLALGPRSGAEGDVAAARHASNLDNPAAFTAALLTFPDRVLTPIAVLEAPTPENRVERYPRDGLDLSTD